MRRAQVKDRGLRVSVPVSGGPNFVNIFSIRAGQPRIAGVATRHGFGFVVTYNANKPLFGRVTAGPILGYATNSVLVLAMRGDPADVVPMTVARRQELAGAS